MYRTGDKVTLKATPEEIKRYINPNEIPKQGVVTETEYIHWITIEDCNYLLPADWYEFDLKPQISLVDEFNEMYWESLKNTNEREARGIDRARYLIIDEFLEKDGDCH